MTKEELEKATGMELIEQRNYCGVDGYYGDYILDVNAEMLKRFNRLTELEKENAELKEFYEKEYFEIADRTADEKIKELEKYQTEVTVDDYNHYDPNTWGMMHEEMFVPKELVRDLLKESYALSEHRNDQLTKARDLILNLYNAGRDVLMCRNEESAYTRLDKAINDKRIEQFLKEVSE